MTQITCVRRCCQVLFLIVVVPGCFSISVYREVETSFPHTEMIQASHVAQDADPETLSSRRVDSAIQQTSSHRRVIPADHVEPALLTETLSDQDATASPTDATVDREVPIDLANALAMGGASHLQIQLAREQIVEAHAKLLQAETMWLPSIRFGVSWNRHDGRLQETEGTIREFDRSSLFIGGGAGLGDASLAGGSGGPARLMVNLSLADAIFAPLVAERELGAQCEHESAVINQALLEVAIAYFDLMEAWAQRANIQTGHQAAEHLAKLTSDFEAEGAGNLADVDRAKAELASWNQRVLDADRRTAEAESTLKTLLRLDPSVRLVPAEETMVAIDLIPQPLSLDSLVAEGIATRGEVGQHQAMIESHQEQLAREYWRPWLPHLQVGFSGGSFGGGSSSNFENQGDRSDFDLAAVWEVQNLGYGVTAQRRQKASAMRQAELHAQWVHDQITQQVATAAENVTSYGSQLQAAQQSIQAAAQSYQRNRQRVADGEGLPIELQQAMRAHFEALSGYTAAVARYNRAQFRLLHAIGRVPSALSQTETGESSEDP